VNRRRERAAVCESHKRVIRLARPCPRLRSGLDEPQHVLRLVGQWAAALRVLSTGASEQCLLGALDGVDGASDRRVGPAGGPWGYDVRVREDPDTTSSSEPASRWLEDDGDRPWDVVAGEQIG